MSEFVTVATRDEVPPGTFITFSIDYEFINLFNVDGVFYATADRCSHAEVALSGGEYKDGVIECPKHGARFDVRTGAVLAPPATQAIRCYKVRVVGDDIQVEVD